MKWFEKLYSLVIFLAALIGLGLGQFEVIQQNAELLILPLLILMLYITFLQIPLEQTKQAFRNARFSSVALVINFVVTPLFAWLLASLFLGNEPALYIGFIMLMVTPCTDWYLIFTGIAKGNVALSTAMLPVNLILQIILLPFYLLVFAGTSGSFEFSFLLESVLAVLLLPLSLAIATRKISRKKKWLKKQQVDQLASLPILFLALAIMAMFASQGSLLLTNLDLLWQLLLPILLFFLVMFSFGQQIGKSLKFSYEETASLNMTTLSRNSPIALAIAMTAFPDEPLIALTLVIGPLLELPILAAIAQVLLVLRKFRPHP
ncbi:MAG: bile acid:sodium symporter [Planococcus sp. (in: firmicutes)]|nr:bile acid:sodium symporter [Planococcus sp. (in: firmicutes)]